MAKIKKETIALYIDDFKSLMRDLEEAWGKIKHLGNAAESNPEKDAAVEILNNANSLREELLANYDGLENGFSKIEYELDGSDTLGKILKQFEDVIGELEEYGDKLYPPAGKRIPLDFSGQAENMTEIAFREKAEESVSYIVDLDEFFENLLADSPYESDKERARAAKNLMFHQPLETWGDEEKKEIYGLLPSEECLKSISEFTWVAVPEEISEKNLLIDYESNNFKSLGCSISLLADFYEETTNKLRDKLPCLDLDFPNKREEQISRSADEIYEKISSAGYVLENEPTHKDLVKLTHDAPDISIYEDGGEFYICSNSSELDVEQAKKAYEIIDGEVPLLLAVKIDADTERMAERDVSEAFREIGSKDTDSSLELK